MMAKIILFFLFFYIFGWLFLTFKITDVPPGINGDEAAIGYNAILVSRTGYDQNGRFLPLFISAFDLTDWKQPVTFYSTVLAFKVFGSSFSLLREVSVFFVLVSATLIFLFSREILGIKAAFISLFIFMTIPAVLIQSHLALENIAPVPFIILWLWMLSKYQKNLESKYLLLSAIFLGISLFTYPGMRLIFPVFSLMTIVLVYFLNRKKRIKKIVLENLKFLIVVSIFPIFMYSVKNQYPGAILAYNRPHNIESYQQLILPYISSFDLSFLFIRGDSTSYHSTGKQGVFLLATLPLFAFGVLKIAQRKDPFLIFILLVFFLSPLLYGLVGSIHRGSRLLVLLPTYTIIASVGFIDLSKLRWQFVSKLLIIIILGLVILNYADFVRDYWYEYPNRVKSEFAKPYHKVFEKAYQLSKTRNLTPLIRLDFRSQNAIAVDFFEQVYFPNKLQLWQDDKLVPKGSIIIVSDPLIWKGSGIVERLVIEDTEYGLLINDEK